MKLVENDKIQSLDPFSIEVFVHNRTEDVRRFRLHVPRPDDLSRKISDIWAKREKRSPDEADYGVEDGGKFH